MRKHRIKIVRQFAKLVKEDETAINVNVLDVNEAAKALGVHPRQLLSEIHE